MVPAIPHRAAPTVLLRARLHKVAWPRATPRHGAKPTAWRRWVVEELTAGHPEEIEDFRVAAGCMGAVEDDGDRTQGIRFQDQPSGHGWKLRMNPSLRVHRTVWSAMNGEESPQYKLLVYSEHHLRAGAVGFAKRLRE